MAKRAARCEKTPRATKSLRTLGTFESRQAKIEAAFHALPNLSPERAYMVPGAARKLALMDGREGQITNNAEKPPSLPETARRLFNATHFDADNKSASQPAIERELESIKQATLHLSVLLSTTHPLTIQMLNLRPNKLSELKNLLIIAMTSAETADISNIPRRTARGRRRNVRAAKIAFETADLYLAITGTMPTRRSPVEGGTAYGPFIDLLKAVFEATGTGASVASQARLAIESLTRLNAMELIEREKARFFPLEK